MGDSTINEFKIQTDSIDKLIDSNTSTEDTTPILTENEYKRTWHDNIMDNNESSYGKEHQKHIIDDLVRKRFSINKYQDWVTYNDIEYTNLDIVSSFPTMVWKFCRQIGMWILSPFCFNPIVGCLIYLLLLLLIWFIVDLYGNTLCIIKQSNVAKNNKYLQTELKFQIDNINKAFSEFKAEKKEEIKKKVETSIKNGKCKFIISTDKDKLLEYK